MFGSMVSYKRSYYSRHPNKNKSLIDEIHTHKDTTQRHNIHQLLLSLSLLPLSYLSLSLFLPLFYLSLSPFSIFILFISPSLPPFLSLTPISLPHALNLPWTSGVKNMEKLPTTLKVALPQTKSHLRDVRSVSVLSFNPKPSSTFV